MKVSCCILSLILQTILIFSQHENEIAQKNQQKFIEIASSTWPGEKDEDDKEVVHCTLPTMEVSLSIKKYIPLLCTTFEVSKPILLLCVGWHVAVPATHNAESSLLICTKSKIHKEDWFCEFKYWFCLY